MIFVGEIDESVRQTRSRRLPFTSSINSSISLYRSTLYSEQLTSINKPLIYTSMCIADFTCWQWRNICICLYYAKR